MARVNTKKAFDAWRRGTRARPAPSIWTDGLALYSYGTEIARRNGTEIAFNSQKYSCTTTCQQRGLLSLMGGMGMQQIRTFDTEEEYRKHVNS